MIDQQRLDLTSASSAYRRRRCPGSVNLINLLRHNGKLIPEERDPDAESGTLVHRAWCATPETELPALNPMQKETLEKLMRLERLVVAEWAGRDQYTLLGREQRLWLHEGLEPIHSGQFDVAYGTISTRRMLILDGKTLFAEVSPAESNDQLRELMALARFNYPGATEFTLGILQPWVTQAPVLARFDATEAELALRLLRHTILDSSDPDAPRTAGAWCKHCPAIAQCEEARVWMGSTFDLAAAIAAGDYIIPLGAKGDELLDRMAQAETVMKALRGRYKQILASDPDALGGWYLKAGNKVREISDSFGAFEIARGAMSLTDFMSAAELKIGALEEKLGKERFAQIFAQVITWKQQAPKLTRRANSGSKQKELELPDA